MKIWKFTCLFYLSNWINQSSFEVLSLENVLINRKLSQKCKIAFTLKTTVYEYIIFIWTKLAMKQLLQKLYSEFLHVLNFCCTWNRNKEISSCRLNFVTFPHNLIYMVISFVFSLDITVMINVFWELIKIVNDDMLKATILYRFLHDASD